MRTKIKINHKSDRALNPTSFSAGKAKGRVRTKRLEVPDSGWETVSIPDRMESMLVRNGGANTLRIRLGAAPVNQFFTIAPGVTLPTTIQIRDNVTMRFKAATGGSWLELILWS